ncbi:MAG TPA: SCE4755 family polysaccharide monooxygenase-like protein [Kofleriaceae bacterium]|nr:SCE4755 family polysaccharide monooxygenase-like protein [Kofleriaceae bacterium]
MRALAWGLVLVPSIASAHINMSFPLERNLTDQKLEHCGTANWVRADHPDRTSTFAPGSTITVTWTETINHPGHFRIAFQPDGEKFPIPPAAPGLCKGSVACPNGVANCDFPTVNQEGVDPTTGAIVLKDFIADGSTSLDITLPNMECTNCTLQLIQLMTDKCPYTTDAASDDIYFRCADITLSASAPDAGPPPPGDGALPGNDAGNPDTGDGGGGGCCSAGGDQAAPFSLLAATGLMLAWRRRRR